MFSFESHRLIFRDWIDSDLSEFCIMNKDDKVMEFFPKTLDEDGTYSFCETIQKEFSEYGYGLYAGETKVDNEFIGFIGFHWAEFKSPFTPCIEIGWRLKYEAWGKGYAAEGAKACLKYGTEILKFDKVYSFTSKVNLKSENVMKKIGLIKLDEFEHPNIKEGSPLKRHILYGISLSNMK